MHSTHNYAHSAHMHIIPTCAQPHIRTHSDVWVHMGAYVCLCVCVYEHVCGEGCMCTCMCGGVMGVHVHRCVMHIHNCYTDIHVQYAHTYSVYVCVVCVLHVCTECIYCMCRYIVHIHAHVNMYMHMHYICAHTHTQCTRNCVCGGIVTLLLFT